MEERKKRANKRQQELLVERLHANLEMARGNLADPTIVELWASLTNELNSLGCNRNIQMWQHIWNSWVAKVKTKARKIRDSIRATGGGPAVGQELTEVERRILTIVGTASVHGFATVKAELPPPLPISSPPVPVLLQPLEASPQQQPQQPTPTRRRAVPRRRLPRPYRHPNDNLIQIMQESNRSLHETIRLSAAEIAAAIRDSSAATLRAAEILAAALSSAPSPSNHIKTEYIDQE